MWAFLDSRIAAHGPFLCGNEAFVCDTYLAMLARWSRNMAQPAATYPNLRQLIGAIIARPGYARLLSEEGIQQIV